MQIFYLIFFILYTKNTNYYLYFCILSIYLYTSYNKFVKPNMLCTDTSEFMVKLFCRLGICPTKAAFCYPLTAVPNHQSFLFNFIIINQWLSRSHCLTNRFKYYWYWRSHRFFITTAMWNFGIFIFLTLLSQRPRELEVSSVFALALVTFFVTSSYNYKWLR